MSNRLQKIQKNYFDNWMFYVNELKVPAEREKKIFRIDQRGNKFNLVLNFDESLFRLSKERQIL